MSAESRSRDVSRRKILVAAFAALLLLGFYTVSDPARLQGHVPLKGADLAGYAVCHRITERSFAVAGRQLPLCARCTGMYLGFALTMAMLGLAGRWRWSRLPSRHMMFLLGVLVAVMGVDGLNSYSHFFPNLPHLYTPQNWLRLLTGLGTGVAMALVLWPSAAETLWRAPQRRPVLGSMTELGGLLLVTAVAALLVLSNQPVLLYVLALISAAGVVSVVTLLNMMVGLLVIRRDGRAEGWPQTVVPLLAGLALAVIQLGAIAYVRFAWTGTMTGLPGL